MVPRYLHKTEHAVGGAVSPAREIWWLCYLFTLDDLQSVSSFNFWSG